MKEFRVGENGFKPVRRQLILRMTIMFTAIFMLVGVLPALISDAPGRFNTLPVLAVLMAGVSVFSVWQALKKQRPIFESLVLKIDDEKIVRERLNTPTLIINRNDISKITKAVNGEFSIYGKSKLNPIVVPAQMENYEEMERALHQVTPLTVLSSKGILEKMSIPISLSGAVLMAITFVSKNDTIVLTCSILVLLILSAALVMTQMNQNIDKRTKRLSWVVLIPLAAFLSRIIATLSE